MRLRIVALMRRYRFTQRQLRTRSTRLPFLLRSTCLSTILRRQNPTKSLILRGPQRRLRSRKKGFIAERSSLPLRGIVLRCCRGSVESLTQRFSGLPCLARKLMFSSRFIVAFIGSFASPLLSVVRKCYSLRSPFTLR